MLHGRQFWGWLASLLWLGSLTWMVFYGFDWAHKMDAKLAAKREAKRNGKS